MYSCSIIDRDYDAISWLALPAPRALYQRGRTRTLPEPNCYRVLKLRFWCSGRDSNSHGLRHCPLKTACLPIPPPEQRSFLVRLVLGNGFFRFLAGARRERQLGPASSANFASAGASARRPEFIRECHRHLFRRRHRHCLGRLLDREPRRAGSSGTGRAGCSGRPASGCWRRTPSPDCRRPREKARRAARAENRAGRARTECGAGIGTFASLQQHQAMIRIAISVCAQSEPPFESYPFSSSNLYSAAGGRSPGNHPISATHRRSGRRRCPACQAASRIVPFHAAAVQYLDAVGDSPGLRRQKPGMCLCTSWACSGVAVIPVPIAQTGS